MFMNVFFIDPRNQICWLRYIMTEAQTILYIKIYCEHCHFELAKNAIANLFSFVGNQKSSQSCCT